MPDSGQWIGGLPASVAAAVAAGVVALLTSVLGALLNERGLRAKQREQEREFRTRFEQFERELAAKQREALEAWSRARSDIAAKLAVDALRETVTALASAGHSQCWVTWKAQFDALSLSAADLDRYDEEMHGLLPKILGGQAALLSLNPVAAADLQEAVNEITRKDFDIGNACVRWREGHKQVLADEHAEAVQAYERAQEICRGVGSRLLVP